MTAILEVLIGLILVFLLFAIVVSGVQEWWSQYFGHRGKFLRQGLMRLIDDEALYLRVLHHPLIGGLYRDRAARGRTTWPRGGEDAVVLQASCST